MIHQRNSVQDENARLHNAKQALGVAPQPTQRRYVAILMTFVAFWGGFVESVRREGATLFLCVFLHLWRWTLPSLWSKWCMLS